MRKLLAAVAAIAIGATALVSTPVEVQAVEYPCEVGNVQIEPQSWWREPNEAWPGRHIHMQLCWPTGVVTGTFTRDIKLVLHEQPTPFEIIRMRIKDEASGRDVWVANEETIVFADDGQGNFTATVRASFDTSGLTTGIHSMQLNTMVTQPNGAQQWISSGLAMYVRSTSGGQTSRNFWRANGWYTDFEYLSAQTSTPLANFREISQPFSFNATCTGPSLASTADVTDCDVVTDPNAHSGFAGNPVPRSSSTATVSGLAPGLHKIAINAEAQSSVRPGFLNSLMVITVLVPGAVAPTPTPVVTPAPTPTPVPPTPTPVPTPVITPSPSTC